MRIGLKVCILSIVLVSGMVSSTSATETNSRHTIVDTFAEGGNGESEVFAIPDELVQKVVRNEEVQYLNSRTKCETYDSGACASGSVGLSLRFFLPICSTEQAALCVEGVEVSRQQGAALIPGEFIGLVDGRTFSAVPSKGLPSASTTSRWRVPGAVNAGGSETYAVKVIVDAFKTAASKEIWIFDVSAIVEPYVTGPTQDGDDACTSWRTKVICGNVVDFNAEQRVALSLRLPNSVTGWLNGRLRNANITVTPMDSLQNRLRVEATPVVVPEVSVTLTKSEFEALPNPSYFTSQGLLWNSVNAGNVAALEWIRQLSGVMKDTASGEHTAWFFSTVAGKNPNACLSDKSKLIGLVTTNAAVYSPGAPDFQDGFLNYKVAGLHFRPDGKNLNLGTYDLLIRSDVARCLYGFTDAPLSATVTVVDDQAGEKRVESTIVEEKDGWLKLGAYGFTFSQPTLKVKILGKKISQSTNKRIVCMKGKVKKAFSYPSKSCPKGWKKVS